jgi:hypothetical protein
LITIAVLFQSGERISSFVTVAMNACSSAGSEYAPWPSR